MRRERHEIVQETGSILDVVMDKASALKGELGARDQVMLAEYLELGT